MVAMLGLGAAAFPALASAEPASQKRPSQAVPPPPRPGDFNRLPTASADCLELAQRYADGRGLRKDLAQAGRWGFLAAMGGADGGGAWLSSRANSGDAYAQYFLAAYLDRASSPSRDTKTAASWFAKAIPALKTAAEGGEASAAYVLALAYKGGQGVPANPKEYREWMGRAAAVHYPPAVSEFGIILIDGVGGPKKPEDGVTLIEGAATLGHVQAQQNMGVLYRQGNVVPKDGTRAAKWFELAALAGDAESQFQLARMKQRGEGIPQDPVYAREMYRRSAEQGVGASANNLGNMVQRGEGAPADPAGAIAWFQRGAELKDEMAALNLGDAYRDGVGTAVDLDAAKQAYERATALGAEPAKRRLSRLGALRKCDSAPTATLLFGVPIRCATRGRLRQAVAHAGATPVREDGGFFYDLYKSGALLEGSSELQLGYTEADAEFARAVYVFPSHVDAQQIVRVAEMVGIKYGKFQRRTGNVGLGPAAFEWRLKDGITLRVSRDWPDTTTYLEYLHPDRFAALKKELADAEARGKVKKSLSQSNAF
jgi:TPR repeat protein